MDGAILLLMEKEFKLYLRPMPPVAEASSRCLKGRKWGSSLSFCTCFRYSTIGDLFKTASRSVSFGDWNREYDETDYTAEFGSFYSDYYFIWRAAAAAAFFCY